MMTEREVRYMARNSKMQDGTMPSILSVYEFYDRPILYSARDEAGVLLLVLLLEELPAEDLWLTVEISRQRLERVERSEVEVRAAFAQAENDRVSLMREDARTGMLISKREIACAQLTNEMLPEPGYSLRGL